MKTWITPFAYIDDAGVLHLCADRVCEDLGLPKTEENLRMAGEHLVELLKKVQPQSKVYSNVERHLREHPEKIERDGA